MPDQDCKRTEWAHGRRPITAPARKAQRSSGSAANCLIPFRASQYHSSVVNAPAGHADCRGEFLVQSITCRPTPRPRFVCHNRAAMRIPTRIPVNGATSPAAPPRYLSPGSMLATRGENSWISKRAEPNIGKIRSGSGRSSTFLAKPENRKNRKSENAKRSEPNLGQIPSKSDPPPIDPGCR